MHFSKEFTVGVRKQCAGLGTEYGIEKGAQDVCVAKGVFIVTVNAILTVCRLLLPIYTPT